MKPPSSSENQPSPKHKPGRRPRILQEIPIRSYFICTYVCRRAESGAEFLLLKRSGGYMRGVWQPVTGRIERGEKAWETALREVREETGLIPQTFYCTDLVQMFYNHTQDGINLVPVFLVWVDPNANVRLSDEHDDYRWLAAEPAKDMLTFIPQRQSVDDIIAGFVLRPGPNCLKMKIPDHYRRPIE